LNYTRRSVQSSLALNTIQASTSRLVRSCGWRIRNLIKRSTRQALPSESITPPDALNEPDASHLPQRLPPHHPRRQRQPRRDDLEALHIICPLVLRKFHKGRRR